MAKVDMASGETGSGEVGRDFLDPNFISLNNTQLKSNRTTIEQRRLVSGFGSVTADIVSALKTTTFNSNVERDADTTEINAQTVWHSKWQMAPASPWA